ncbi:hypothetical protein [Reinekea sp. G2M2-21]|uniref:hypothetical protein n=1 Tax=Reinekea sp. G2M2-21 TaxID=2788942 RepID=UPI0018A9E093|nr:hypothetical protein [Reinekea sp. G2M2-21]
MGTFKHCQRSQTIRETETNAAIAVHVDNRWVLDVDPTAGEIAATTAFATLYKRPDKRYLGGAQLVSYLNKSLQH